MRGYPSEGRASLVLRRELGDKHGVATSPGGLARLALSRADLGTASALWSESLTLFRELGDRGGLLTCLDGIAALCARRADLGRAVDLLHAATALRHTLGLPRHPCARADHEALERALRASLAPETLAALAAQVEALTLDDAAALAASQLLAPSS